MIYVLFHNRHNKNYGNDEKSHLDAAVSLFIFIIIIVLLFMGHGLLHHYILHHVPTRTNVSRTSHSHNREISVHPNVSNSGSSYSTYYDSTPKQMRGIYRVPSRNGKYAFVYDFMKSRIILRVVILRSNLKKLHSASNRLSMARNHTKHLQRNLKRARNKKVMMRNYRIAVRMEHHDNSVYQHVLTISYGFKPTNNEYVFCPSVSTVNHDKIYMKGTLLTKHFSLHHHVTMSTDANDMTLGPFNDSHNVVRFSNYYGHEFSQMPQMKTQWTRITQGRDVYLFR